MNLDEFLENLAALKMRWHLEDGAIRCGGHCPITAVIGDSEFYDQAVQAGRSELGLSVTDACGIVHSADDVGPDFSPALRSRLLKACGLEEMT